MATAAAGIVVLFLSCVKLMVLSRAEEAATLLAGLWLVAGPFVLGYAGTSLGMLHLILGAAISGSLRSSFGRTGTAARMISPATVVEQRRAQILKNIGAMG